MTSYEKSTADYHQLSVMLKEAWLKCTVEEKLQLLSVICEELLLCNVERGDLIEHDDVVQVIEGILTDIMAHRHIQREYIK
jgi:hypothetical protein